MSHDLYHLLLTRFQMAHRFFDPRLLRMSKFPTDFAILYAKKAEVQIHEPCQLLSTKYKGQGPSVFRLRPYCKYRFLRISKFEVNAINESVETHASVCQVALSFSYLRWKSTQLSFLSASVRSCLSW